MQARYNPPPTPPPKLQSSMPPRTTYGCEGRREAPKPGRKDPGVLRCPGEEGAPSRGISSVSFHTLVSNVVVQRRGRGSRGGFLPPGPSICFSGFYSGPREGEPWLPALLWWPQGRESPLYLFWLEADIPVHSHDSRTRGFSKKC